MVAPYLCWSGILKYFHKMPLQFHGISITALWSWPEHTVEISKLNMTWCISVNSVPISSLCNSYSYQTPVKNRFPSGSHINSFFTLDMWRIHFSSLLLKKKKVQWTLKITSAWRENELVHPGCSWKYNSREGETSEPHKGFILLWNIPSFQVSLSGSVYPVR